MKRLLTTGCVLAFGVGCATASLPPALVAARNANEQVKKQPPELVNPAELQAARQELENAEDQVRRDPESWEADDASYIALRRMEALLVRARGKQAEMHRAQVARQLAAGGAVAANAADQARMSALNAEVERLQKEMDETRRLSSEQQEKNAAAMEELSKVAKVRQEERGLVVSLSGAVLFASGKSSLLPSAKRTLDQVAETLKQAKGRPITVEGHTDSQGGEEMNEALSQRRAESVRVYLINQGVPQDKITAKGLGESAPVAGNDTSEGRATNRRVELVLSNVAAPSEASGGSGPAETPPSAPH